MTCRIDDCPRPVKVAARQLCNSHYIQAQRAGALEPLDRFAANVEQGEGCWLWTGRTEKGGYGRWGGGMAHRVAWVRVNGPIPDGLTIDHLCRNHACVNPSHLRLLPPSENFSDNSWRDRQQCVNGHEWSQANTRIGHRKGRTHRICRACDRDRQAKAAARRRAANESPAQP